MVDVIEQLITAMNRHDAGAVAAFFAADYRSEQPLHPNRGFGGSDQVLANWTSVFEGVPDFFAERVASAVAEDTVWSEMRWEGSHRDGSPFRMRGVTVTRRARWQDRVGSPVHGAGRGGWDRHRRFGAGALPPAAGVGMTHSTEDLCSGSCTRAGSGYVTLP